MHSRRKGHPHAPGTLRYGIAVGSRLLGCWLVLSGCAVLAGHDGGARSVLLMLRNGTCLRVAADAFEVTWTEFRTSGSNLQRRYSQASVNRIKLSETQASELLDEAKRCLVDLGHENYHCREQAEATLRSMLEQSINPMLRDLIETAIEDERLEVRFRAQRVLSDASRPTAAAPTGTIADKFDWLWLKDGRQLRGDAGEFHFSCEWRGQMLTWSRREIAEIQFEEVAKTARPTPPESWLAQGPRTWNQPPEARPIPLTTIEFEKDALDNPLQRNEYVDTSFVDMGLKLEADVGHVGISGYEIQMEGVPTQGNSICVYDTRGSITRKFKGTIEFSFCVPGQFAQPAGVHWFECYAARLDNPRDFVLQAFNADGHLLATVESTDFPCGFFAVGSAEPIARVRFRSNPHLFHLKRLVDEDYAIDNVAFSTPVAIPGLVGEGWTVVLRDGDRLGAQRVDFNNHGGLTLSDPVWSEPIAIEISEVAEIHFPQVSFPAPNPASPHWFVLTPERSVWAVQPGAEWTLQRRELESLTKDRILALWSGRDHLRFPELDEVDGSTPILVFPTGRIVAEDFVLGAEKLEWDVQRSTTRFQLVHVRQPERATASGLGDEEESPLPREIQSVSLVDPNSGHLPSIWFSQPAPLASAPAAILLRNGEQFVLSEAAGIRIASITAAGVTLQVSSATLNLSFDEIHRIVFP